MKSVYWRPKKVSATNTLVIGLFAVFLLSTIELAPLLLDTSATDKQKIANEIASQCRQHLLELRTSKGMQLNALFDLNQTGLVGTAMSPITSKPANLESKQLSLHPSFPGTVAQLLLDAGVSPGDTVAIGWTGSFPGLNISLAAAVEALDLQPIIVSSVTASQYGANEPEFTWLDMETSLRNAGLTRCQSTFATVGGPADRGAGMGNETHALVEAATQRNDIELRRHRSCRQSIDSRMQLYNNAGVQIGAYINVGGGIASCGGTSSIFTSGLTKVPCSEPGPDCVMKRFNDRETPVIHLAYPRTLAAKSGLSMSPEGFQTAAFTGRPKPSRIAALCGLIVIASILYLCVLSDHSARAWMYIQSRFSGKPALRAVGQAGGPQLMA